MKNLTQLPGSGKSSKAKNDNTLGLMHVGIRSRIGSMSLKNTSLFGVILALLLTLSVGEMWGADYQQQGNNAGWWGSGGLIFSWAKNSTTATTTLNYNGGSGTSLGEITTALKITNTTVKFWRTSGSGNICSSTIWWELFKGSTSIATGNYSPATWGSWSGSNNTMTSTTNIDFFSKTTGPGNYTIKIYAKLTGGANSSSACTDNFWYNNNNTGTYSITFSIPSKNLTVAGAANGNTVSGSVTGITKGTAYTITATPTTGYNFSSWSATSGSSSISIGNTSSASTTVTFSNYSSNATVTASFTPKTTTITLNNAGATTSGSTSVTATYGEDMPAITLPTKTGYTFGGYWGAPGGSGPKYYNADGTSSCPWPNTESTYTLYAAWAENKSTVTLVASPSGKGTFQVGGETVTSTLAGVATTPAVTAMAISGYRFSSWSISGGASISSTSDNPTTVTGGGAGTAATLTATFVEDLTYYTLQFNARSGETSYGSVAAKDDSDNPLTSGTKYLSGTSVTLTATATDEDYKFDSWYPGWTTGDPVSTDNPLTFSLSADTKRYAHFVQKTTSITLNKGIGSGGTAGPVTATHGSTTLSTNPLVNPAKSGYTFTGYWTESSGGVKVIDTDGTLVASVSGYTKSGNKKWDYDDPTLTLYAQYSEKMTTVTVNVSPAGAGTLTVGGDAFTPGNTTTAGVATSRTVVASTNTGYIFNNWTTTGNATGSATTNTYTLKGNGSAGTGTLTANFTEKTLVRLYFSNPNNWANLYAYVWDSDNTSDNNGWPGEVITANTYISNCNTFFYFEYYKEDHPNWNYLIFNNGSGGDGNQTADLPYSNTTNNGQYTNGIASDWYASPTARWSLFGSWDSWAAGSALTCASATSGYVELTLAANTDYEFKFVDNAASAWYGATTVTKITYSNKATAQSMNSTTGSNQTITTAGAGTYRFDWNITSKQVTVTYPTSYTVTYGIGTGGASISATVGGNALASGKYVTAGSDVTFTQTPATGYTFNGWYTAASGGSAVATMGVSDNVLNSISANATVYAQYSANNYTVTLDVDEENKGTIAGATTSQSVTYGAALTTIPNLPTAAAGYGLDGYYTDQNGAGTKVINGDGTWIASVEGYTDADTKWIHAGDATLYAYYKQAEITELTLAETIVGTAETDSITVTPVIAPLPSGTTIVCWEVQYSNGNALSPQPAGRLVSGNTYRFKAPTASATYKIEATLRSGAVCGGGSVLSTLATTFQVAGEHTVTVLYKCDDLTLAASSEVNARPLEWSDEIVAPDITGYTFSGWEAGDGVTIKDGEDATATTHIKAVYDGTLTANYTKKRLIYFNNTLNWANVYVYFYKNNSYWDDAKGAGTKTTYTYTDTPYSEGLHGEMTQIDGTNIYYFDAEAAGVNSSYTCVAFTEANQHDYEFFYETNVVRRDDYKSTTLPMFVPIAEQTPEKYNNNKTNYYFKGYWMNYPENTGYTLKIYNQKATAGAVELRSVPFAYSADLIMPLEVKVDLEAGRTYGFKIYRADGTTYGNTGTMTANTMNWEMTSDASSNCGLTTTAAGDYTFNLYYSDYNEDGDYQYRVDVTYPVAANDYRIVYSDLAAWSGATHTAAWIHPSRVITKNSGSEAKQDTVSFFWAFGSSPALKYQTCTAVGTGSATWSAGTAISVSSFSSVLTKTGVYNFIFEQPAGGASISLVKVEPYEGKYYIRTDCAGATKWANYRTIDHEMTYSDYAETNSGFSHYFAHWVTSGTNVKFTIANDYSPCVSDTLTADYGTVVANINAGGDLVSGNANIRYMWNQSDNKLSRAYISGSGNIADRFLVLEGDAKMYDENGNALTTAGGGKISGLEDNEMNLIDDENFVYERTIQVNTQARAKLTAKYNNNVQYFIGGASETVELLGGAASETKYTMRIVYDFKTNRLVTAYMPSDAAITEALAINADIMLVREHQNAGQQLTFEGDGSLSAVKTVYGVMRFNRWTLNNKSTADGHAPVGDPKSTYERSLYWISFPFDVNLSDVFGFGTYGTHWIIEEYDGAERAKEGYWKDSEGFWKYITNRRGVTLEAGKGYILALDLDLMRDNNTSFWSNEIQQVELFFPSAAAVENIEETDTEIDVPAHECTIAPRPGQTDDRTKKDSHWNIIGVPSYANYGSTLKNGSDATITWNDDPETKDLPFLYEWNMVDNSYSVQSGTTYPFKSMHAYMVQYNGKLKWSLASATPSPVVARHADAPQDVEFRLELQAGEKTADQTFVKMSTDEQITTAFDFNYDLSKQMNSGKANIYTMVEGYIQTAGNCLPMSEQTTVVPVGVKIAAEGDYTFAIPEGTEGVGVTLIDQETGIRTSLSALAYTVSLEAGTYDERFVLEISPIHNVPTEQSAVRDQQTDVRKVLIDGLLYIVRDNKMYDARGAMIMEK